jgi:transposase
VVEKELAVQALPDPVVARLMTIPGVDAIAAMAIVAAVGDFGRFTDPDRLVAYVGLNPKVRQSGNSAPVHGRISKAGRGHRPVGRCILTAPALQQGWPAVKEPAMRTTRQSPQAQS